ncbi:ATPase AAA [Candidatus Magnetomorum sp. HK-1]|nr:ATPase AAA [Candidatus Magnetomorum sp. HK-1]
MLDLLYQYNPWWEGDFPQIYFKNRDKYISKITQYLYQNQIVFMTGLRRVGKTTLMKLMIKNLIDQGVGPDHLLYVSLDDYMLREKSIIEILNEYRKLHKIRIDEKIYVFFDEITYKEDYHLQLKNIYDSQNVKIFASSSSSSLLKDKKAHLTGRSITLEIQPLDFNEYMNFKDIKLKKRDTHLYQSFFKDYIREGGLPENVLNPSREYLMNLVEDIIQKDITAFHGLKNRQLVRDYFTLLMERSGKQISMNKMSNILKISPDTSKRYLSYFQSTYLIHLVSRWGKTNERILSPKKIYACDLGIKYLFVGERDLGSYFENYIYLNLKNIKELYYLYENGIEIDFYTSDKIIIESKYYAELNQKQKKLFHEYPSTKRVIIDSIEQLSLLDDI